MKLHTGEQHGPNIIPRDWVKALFEKDLPDARIVETNTYYEGDRYTTEQHRRTLEVNGWTFCPVDILDEEDTTTLPVRGGKWFDRMAVGQPPDRLPLPRRAHPLQGPHARRLRRQQQEHRHRLCRRPHRQSLDSHDPEPGRPVGHRQGRIHGTHDRIGQVRRRLLWPAHHVRQRHAQHVRVVRLRRPGRRARRDARRGHPFVHGTSSPSTRPVSTSSTP